MLYLCRVKPLRHYLRGFLIAAWAGDKIAEFSFPEISFHFPLRPWFFFVSPAYAGKRLPMLAGMCPPWDHPRVCGEKAWTRWKPQTTIGSPPRMRGKVDGKTTKTRTGGITPAYAGKSCAAHDFTMSCQDHPRVCGEKELAGFVLKLRQGSPPRMRGKAKEAVDAMLAERITPAYAGKSSFSISVSSAYWDHPRVCGEKTTRMDGRQRK